MRSCRQRDQRCGCHCVYSIWLRTYAQLGQFDNAWRGIGEAMTAVQTTRVTGEIALMSQERDAAKAEENFDRALAVARQQQAKSWEPRGDEHNAALA